MSEPYRRSLPPRFLAGGCSEATIHAVTISIKRRPSKPLGRIVGNSRIDAAGAGPVIPATSRAAFTLPTSLQNGATQRCDALPCWDTFRSDDALLGEWADF